MELIRKELQRFADRGYQHDAEFWRRVAGTCPDVDLVLEAQKIAEWLREPAHRKELCSKRRLDNWVKKAQGDALARAAAAAGVPGPPPAATRGVLLNGGQYVQPAALQKNPNPEAALPAWDAEQARRSDADRERIREMLPPRLRAASRWRTTG